MSEESPKCMEWEIRKIPEIFNRTQGKHIGTKSKIAKSWKDWILCTMRRAPRDWERKKRRLWITVYRGGLQDEGNMYASLKPVVDAIVHAGWLVDDNREWLESHCEEKIERDARRWFTMVRIEV